VKKLRRFLPWLVGVLVLVWAWRSVGVRRYLGKLRSQAAAGGGTPGTDTPSGPSSMRSAGMGGSYSSRSVVSFDASGTGKTVGTDTPSGPSSMREDSTSSTGKTKKVPWYESDEYAPKPGGNTPGGSCSLSQAKYPPTASKAAFWYMVNVSNEDGLLVWGKCHDGRCGYYPKNDSKRRRYIPETNKLMD